MPTTSRSPAEFLRRHGIVPTPVAPARGLDIGRLKVNRISLLRDQLNPAKLLDVLGSPPPDRGVTDQWPPSQEVL